MSTATSYMCFGCVELAHNARTRAYHAWACQTGRYDGKCVPRLGWLCDCEADGLRSDYTDPVTDNVCWYDPAIPESADFLGIIITKAGGIRTSTFTREVVDGISGGSILQSPMIRGKQIVFEGLILATSCAGMDYGIEFMRRQIEDDGRCPQEVTCTSCQGAQMAVRVHCSDTALDGGLHAFTSAGTIDGFSLVEDDYPMGRTCCCTMRRFTFTVATESAESHETTPTDSCEIDACDPNVFSFLESCDNPPPDECCPMCMDSSCDYCTIDPGCDCFAPYVLAPTKISEAPCYCPPPCRMIAACEVTNVQAGYANAVRITLRSGVDPFDPDFQKLGMRNTVVRVWENPTGIVPPTDEASYEFLMSRVKPCAEIGISWVPAGSDLVLDGVSGKTWLKCQGRCIDHSSRVFTITGSKNPFITRCTPLIVTVEWDPLNHQYECGANQQPSSMLVETFLRFRL